MIQNTLDIFVSRYIAMTTKQRRANAKDCEHYGREKKERTASRQESLEYFYGPSSNRRLKAELKLRPAQLGVREE